MNHSRLWVQASRAATSYGAEDVEEALKLLDRVHQESVA
jgi:hypothetical protein